MNESAAAVLSKIKLAWSPIGFPRGVLREGLPAVAGGAPVWPA
jgi:hypothetical protein